MTFQAHSYINCNVSTFRHESFIVRQFSASRSSDSLVYQCDLCGIYNMKEDDIDVHCTTSQLHEQRIMKVRALQNNPITYCAARLELEIDQLGLSYWKHEIHSKMYWAFMNQFSDDSSILIAYFQEASQLLDKYVKMEVTSLLELAIWKSVCITSKPYPMIVAESLQGSTKNNDDSSSSSSSNEYIVWQNWIRHGWKQQKSSVVRRQQCTEIGTIIALVRPYLFDDAPADHTNIINDLRDNGEGGGRISIHEFAAAAEAVPAPAVVTIVNNNNGGRDGILGRAAGRDDVQRPRLTRRNDNIANTTTTTYTTNNGRVIFASLQDLHRHILHGGHINRPNRAMTNRARPRPHP